MRDAAPALLAERLATSRKVTAVRANAASEALTVRATRLLHGTYESHGKSLHFSLALEDAPSHKMVEMHSFDGALLASMATLALRFDPQSSPFSTGSAAAVSAWGQGNNEQGVSLDPDFGAAWMAWVEQLSAAGKPGEASAVAARALARLSLKTPLHRARLQLAKALLEHDESGRANALQALTALVPEDLGILSAQAEEEQRRRHFTQSAAFYRKILALDPSNTNILNSLGYAEGQAGNLLAARRALEDYGKQPGQAPNSLDSLGEVFFMNGRFTEARKYFEQVAQSNPTFLDGAPLAKSAYARWFAGDRTGADSSMRNYLMFRMQQNDTAIVWREASWLYATGRRDQALAKLAQATPALAALAERQRAVWRGEARLPSGLDELGQLYLAANPAADGLPRTLYAAALLRAGKTEQAKELLRLWPLPEVLGDPLLQSLIYPMYLEISGKVGLR